MAFTLLMFFSFIPLTAAVVLFRLKKQRVTYPLAFFYFAICMWQLSITVLYGEGWLTEEAIDDLFRLLRVGSVIFAPLLFYVVNQLLTLEQLTLSSRKKKILKKIVNRPAFIVLLVWSIAVYVIGWTPLGIVNLEQRSVLPFEEVFYYPQVGELGWTFSLHILLIFAVDLLAIYVTFSIIDKHRRTFLLTFFVSVLFAYGFGVINLSSESPLFQSIWALIILVMGIFTAYVKMNQDMMEEVNGQLLAQQLFLRKVIDANPNFIYAKDQTGNYSMVNAALAQLYRVTPEQMLGKNEQDFYPDHEEAERMVKEDQDLLEKNERKVQEKRYLYTADHRVYTVQMTKKPIFFSEGHKELLCVANDVTEMEQKEEYIRRSEKMNIVGQLAAGVAHEIRNPLTSLKGFVQLIDQEYSIDPKYTTIMIDELERIHFVASELLVLAKPEITIKKTVSLKDLMQDVVELLNIQASMKNITIQIEPFFEDMLFEGNADQLKQVFINVLKNAIEASMESGVITIHLRRTEGMLIISIVDRGIGMSQERIAKLGEPFYTSKEKGTGLGLMVSLRIIKEHGGDIFFESEEGKGTTVTVSLPVQENERKKGDEPSDV